MAPWSTPSTTTSATRETRLIWRKEGWEVAVGVARFWAQRVNWSEAKQAWVILGVTGPNEYENNVNNNWYTNRLAAWCLKSSGVRTRVDAPGFRKPSDPERALELRWLRSRPLAGRGRPDVLPLAGRHPGVRLQQDGFMDKELIHGR